MPLINVAKIFQKQLRARQISSILNIINLKNKLKETEHQYPTMKQLDFLRRWESSISLETLPKPRETVEINPVTLLGESNLVCQHKFRVYILRWFCWRLRGERKMNKRCGQQRIRERYIYIYKFMFSLSQLLYID